MSCVRRDCDWNGKPECATRKEILDNCFEGEPEVVKPDMAEVDGYVARGKNKHGLDADYFVKEFRKLIRDIDNYTPMEMHRYLERLSDAAI